MDALFDALAVHANTPLPAAAQLPTQGTDRLEVVDTDAIVAGLNDQQLAAVTHTGTPLLVVAGAGSGKTRVLTHRIAYQLAIGRAQPGGVLAITFTNKAAAEMRERVSDLIGPPARAMWVSTFHSACVRILRREYRSVGLRSTFSIYDQQDAQRAMSLVVKDMGGTDTNPKVISRRVSDWKNALITPQEALSNARTETERTFALAYQRYQESLQRANAMDFDDLIFRTVMLLREHRDITAHYRRRFRHILVDEYQDTNHAQYQLVRALTGSDDDEVGLPAAELTVVGDADQSIYAFRGASIRNIEDFESDFPTAHTIVLEQNYRSTQHILTAANAVIAENPHRRAKRLWTAGDTGPLAIGYAGDSDRDEARFVAQAIDTLTRTGRYDPADIAVFYRTNAQSRAFEEVFVRTQIPYRIIGGTRFYERKEIKDALAYIRVVANEDDDISLRRIINTPRRGLGEKTIGQLANWADAHQMSLGGALNHLDSIEVPTRSRNQLAEVAEMFADVRAMSQATPAELLEAILDRSGYVAALRRSDDPQDEVRVENLAELYAVATDFSEQHPEGTLGDFLERLALVADSDQLATDAGGTVTLMTVHTAKGLEFPVVFVTGLEQGTFPHARSMDNAAEMAEERRLAYVALTRARRQLYLTRAGVRHAWGVPQELPASEFLDAIPAEVMDW
ncbi:MAG: UvrD-helicase domain-containing protein, partial [Bowdeniella nasicola]|nr:UvrD-helicase domain-containing protein [Bowdeniella nasicola]